MKKNALVIFIYAAASLLWSCSNVEDVTKQDKVVSVDKESYVVDSSIQKNNTQVQKPLKNPDYFNEINRLDEFQKTNKNDLSHSIVIQAVSKAEFLEKKQDKLNEIPFDAFKESNQGVELLCKNENLIIQNNDFDNVESDARKVHALIQYIHEINAVVVRAEYYEGEEFFLYDLESCKKIATFGGKVYYQNNYIFSLFIDPYVDTMEKVGRIEVAKFIPNQPLNKKIYETGWAVSLEPQKEIAPFMSKDGYYYSPVIDASKFWDESGNYNTNYQFAKLKIQ